MYTYYVPFVPFRLPWTLLLSSKHIQFLRVQANSMLLVFFVMFFIKLIIINHVQVSNAISDNYFPYVSVFKIISLILLSLINISLPFMPPILFFVSLHSSIIMLHCFCYFLTHFTCSLFSIVTIKFYHIWS